MLTRLWFSWVCWWRVLFDDGFASSVMAVAKGELQPKASAPALDPPPADRVRAADGHGSMPKITVPSSPAALAVAPPEALEGALQILALLQREGRLVDFLQQDIAAFPDADVGAAARVVHEGCRRALRQHARIDAVRSESEGSSVTVAAAEDGAVKLTGNLSGSPPYRGVLRHRGWRVEQLKLPMRLGSSDPRVVAPAEVEL